MKTMTPNRDPAALRPAAPAGHGPARHVLLAVFPAALLVALAPPTVCHADDQHVPRLASTERAEDHGADENHDHGMSAAMVEPMGILTLALVALAVSLGVLRRLGRLKLKRMLKLHKIVGICALASGGVHAALVLLSH